MQGEMFRERLSIGIIEIIQLIVCAPPPFLKELVCHIVEIKTLEQSIELNDAPCGD